ncbi:hypothetical protein SLEP1_g14349 [Rubroshorea leprosula]|uniref:Uncharacterized protein n=1 Tax=Rubroshorea leprosula TaxID=152421 RepID=A0AAV5IT76_9ROSI|nr:hypothetical protein SLEP1_g14349 [Rubroshorea leprosula]
MVIAKEISGEDLGWFTKEIEGEHSGCVETYSREQEDAPMKKTRKIRFWAKGARNKKEGGRRVQCGEFVGQRREVAAGRMEKK